MTENKELTPLVNLKKLRLRAGKTLKEVSESTGISYSALSAYERGTRKPKYEQLETLAKFFHVTASYIQGFVKNPNPVTADDDYSFESKGLETLENFEFVDNEMLKNRLHALYEITFGIGTSKNAPELETKNAVEIMKIVDNIFTALLSNDTGNKQFTNNPSLLSKQIEDQKILPEIYDLIKTFSNIIWFAPLIGLEFTYDPEKLSSLESDNQNSTDYIINYIKSIATPRHTSTKKDANQSDDV
ncbi:XRE family transcriptional regulator [Weissella confusa]|uniref:helix-turn-helix domain-containing protein n=1 Tax=Weissella confusa TaxID=1583 RepID=UPI00223ACC2F|nr:helix-turn-helix transcriptional regulator [Weissella confusa]MCS9991700.1 XRE family transcriptional regulator [Weissella confusa]MCS9995911.1 XRE family transcriptional regulator [Weissella confusa]